MMAGPQSTSVATTRAKAFQPFLATLEQQGRTVAWVARQLSAMTGQHVEASALWNYLHGRRRIPEDLVAPLRYVLGVPVDMAYVELPRHEIVRLPRQPKPPQAKRPRGRPRKYPAGEARTARGPPAA